MWTQEQAVALCVRIEAVAPAFGCHVAMTGGCLYKEAKVIGRKDLDLVFYRIRSVPYIQMQGLFVALHRVLGFTHFAGGGWRYIAMINGESVDLLFPEECLQVDLKTL